MLAATTSGLAAGAAADSDFADAEWVGAAPQHAASTIAATRADKRRARDFRFIAGISLRNAAILTGSSRKTPALSHGRPGYTRAMAEITDLLVRARGGDVSAVQTLMPLVYQRLRELAHRQ